MNIADRRTTHKDRPEDRTALYYERAKQLSLLSGGSSIELERQLREVYKALSYQNEEVRLYILLGKIYKHNLDISSALFCYRYALKKDPSNLSAQKLLVSLLTIKGKELMMTAMDMQWRAKFVAARSFFDEALEYSRDNQELLILKAVAHVHCEELTEAFDAVNRACQPHKHPTAEMFILRAKVNWGRGLVEQGNHDIRTAAAMHPEHPEVLAYIERSYAKSEKLYEAALEHFTNGKYSQSLELVNHALFLTNEDVKLYVMQSKIHRMTGALQSAYESILHAKAIFESKYKSCKDYNMSLPPELALQIHLILNEMALNYVTEGNYDKAILLFNKIIKDSSSSMSSIVIAVDYKYYMNRGDCYRALNQLSEAILDYLSALAIEPNDWNINIRLSLSYYLLALDLFNSSHFLDAERELSQAIAYNPKVAEYYALRGKARYYTTSYQQAYEDYTMVMQLDPDNTEIKQRLQQFEEDRPVKTMLEPNITSMQGHPIAKTDFTTMTTYRHEKIVQAVKTQEQDHIEAMLHPQAVRKTFPVIKLLQPTVERGEQDRPRPTPTLTLDHTLDNSGHFIKKPLPMLAINSHSIEQHAFKKAIYSTETVHAKSVAVVQQYMNKPSLEKGTMWSIVDTAKALALAQSRDRDRKLIKKMNDASRSVSTTSKSKGKRTKGVI